MTKELWMSLPVRDVQKSREFFTTLGFSFHPRHINSDEMAGLLIGENNVMVMLCQETTFRKFIQTEIADTKQGVEILFSIDAQSREEVDDMAQKAVQAGGTIFGEPKEQEGWMYGCGFADLDCHRWNVLYMDMSKMPTVSND